MKRLGHCGTGCNTNMAVFSLTQLAMRLVPPTDTPNAFCSQNSFQVTHFEKPICLRVTTFQTHTMFIIFWET